MFSVLLIFSSKSSNNTKLMDIMTSIKDAKARNNFKILNKISH